MGLFKKIREKRELERKEKTYEYWIENVQHRDLSAVPSQFRDVKLCLAYVAKSKYCLTGVPAILFNDVDFCTELTKYDLYYHIDKQYIPNIFKLHHNKEFYATALKNDWYFIKFMCLDWFDDKLWEIALKASDGMAFQYYPEEKKQQLKYEDYYKLVKYPYALKYVPINFRDRALCLKAIANIKNNNSYLFQLVPKPYLDEEMYLAMVKACPSYLSEVPNEMYENVRIAYNNWLEENVQEETETTNTTNK